MAALLDPTYAELVASMPSSTFTEAFHLLSPSYFILHYRDNYRPLHPYTVDVKHYRQLQSIFDGFAKNITVIIGIRRSGAHMLGRAEYMHLLDCARSLGDAPMADHIWNSMKEDEVVPDVQCYNYYMEAKVWHSSYAGMEKYRLRMTPYAYRKRRSESPLPGWEGYRTGRLTVRSEVLGIFNEMIEAGNSGDEASFVNLILASGRAGHVQAMKQVLKTVWNVDVDLLKDAPDESERPPATRFDQGSPLWPTENLLFAIAHAFGTNNDIPGALRALDFVASSYNIKITTRVWLELFERTFVLSRSRFGPDWKRNALGKVSHEFLNQVYQTMIQAPFYVKPQVQTFRMLAKSAWTRQRYREFHRHMCDAYAIMKETRRQRKVSRSAVEAYLKEHQHAEGQQRLPSLLQTRAFADAVHTYDTLRIQVFQQTTTLERLARLLLIQTRWTGRDNLAWERQLLPRALEEWKDFLPETFVFPISTGLVAFQGATRWGGHQVKAKPLLQVRRPYLGSEDDVNLDRDAGEIEDELIWARWRDRTPRHERLHLPALNRLFESIRIEPPPPPPPPSSYDDDEALFALDLEDVRESEYIRKAHEAPAPVSPKHEWDPTYARQAKHEEFLHTFGVPQVILT
ncbi:hypothetical protein P175DRAFT_0490574 [Aspergillus ochraceoroseus IBT 24754]|uniref:Uncharacterized protein n=2 Tax=Aspergillus ochraceoroseus TaxID=138278 RepID=A0A2T5MAG2_9EURO|nr:uncharacterized protein P175DRAFT_0490574 [Aspergillus ochraceoroseus IBT 24754]KKK17617.1 hypothetical protein AOCH_006997 [Aspergillus ochraceoroseus]PTU25539.1 hypothetical protein P175DRAFT_0490574 [Aspergillus ochraceoroseus IBT 24754]